MPYEGFLLIMVVRSQECGLIFLHKKWVDASPSTLTTSQKSIKGDLQQTYYSIPPVPRSTFFFLTFFFITFFFIGAASKF